MTWHKNNSQEQLPHRIALMDQNLLAAGAERAEGNHTSACVITTSPPGHDKQENWRTRDMRATRSGEKLLKSPPPNRIRLQPTDCWTCSDSSLDRAGAEAKRSRTKRGRGQQGDTTRNQTKPRRKRRSEAKRREAKRNKEAPTTPCVS